VPEQRRALGARNHPDRRRGCNLYKAIIGGSSGRSGAGLRETTLGHGRPSTLLGVPTFSHQSVAIPQLQSQAGGTGFGAVVISANAKSSPVSARNSSHALRGAYFVSMLRDEQLPPATLDKRRRALHLTSNPWPAFRSSSTWRPMARRYSALSSMAITRGLLPSERMHRIGRAHTTPG